MTRELQVWGVLDGQVVHGVIDELSTTCPDDDLQSELPSEIECKSTASDFKGQSSDKPRKIYITDVKTRASRNLPSGAAFRPTVMQLMLYHHLLAGLAAGKVDAKQLFARYHLNSTAPFSDAFIAQLSSLTDNNCHGGPSPVASQTVSDSDSTESADSLHTLLTNNSLDNLWSLMIMTFQRVLPHGAESVGETLQAEYRDAVDGTVHGRKTFLYNEEVLMHYVEDELRWWKGERGAVGVPIEEAYKCRMCVFADGCTWRQARVEEASANYRLKARSIV
jgi:exonuclease V